MGAKKEEKAHALLSPSAAHKWLYCTASALIEAEYEDKAGEAAKEGTLAHAICELKLTKTFTDQNMSTRTYNSRLKKLQADERYQPEMEGFTDAYLDYIKEIAYNMESAPTVVVEKKVQIRTISADKCFGTADCILLQGTTLHIIDFKYGKGVPVSAEGNPQLALYAIGAIEEYGFIYPIETVVLHIVQPRCNNTNSWTTTAQELMTWGSFAAGQAQEALSGNGKFKQGKWCDSCFCKIAGTCRCRAEENMKLMADATDANGNPRDLATLSDDEIGDILKRAQFLASWVKKLEAYALNRLMCGGSIKGWKLVEGRSNRTFSDIDAAYKALIERGYDESLLYEKSPITLTACEKLVDKDTFKEVAGPYIVKPQGKATLAPADDKRPEFKPGITAKEAFGNKEETK